MKPRTKDNQQLLGAGARTAALAKKNLNLEAPEPPPANRNMELSAGLLEGVRMYDSNFN